MGDCGGDANGVRALEPTAPVSGGGLELISTGLSGSLASVIFMKGIEAFGAGATRGPCGGSEVTVVASADVKSSSESFGAMGSDTGKAPGGTGSGWIAGDVATFGEVVGKTVVDFVGETGIKCVVFNSSNSSATVGCIE